MENCCPFGLRGGVMEPEICPGPRPVCSVYRLFSVRSLAYVFVVCHHVAGCIH